jgi:hypothetical protein
LNNKFEVSNTVYNISAFYWRPYIEQRWKQKPLSFTIILPFKFIRSVISCCSFLFRHFLESRLVGYKIPYFFFAHKSVLDLGWASNLAKNCMKIIIVLIKMSKLHVDSKHVVQTLLNLSCWWCIFIYFKVKKILFCRKVEILNGTLLYWPHDPPKWWKLGVSSPKFWELYPKFQRWNSKQINWMPLKLYLKVCW